MVIGQSSWMLTVTVKEEGKSSCLPSLECTECKLNIKGKEERPLRVSREGTASSRQSKQSPARFLSLIIFSHFLLIMSNNTI